MGEGPYKSNRQAGFKGEGWETRQDVKVEQDNGQHQGLRVARDLGPKMEIEGCTGVCLEGRQQPSRLIPGASDTQSGLPNMNRSLRTRPKAEAEPNNRNQEEKVTRPQAKLQVGAPAKPKECCYRKNHP